MKNYEIERKYLVLTPPENLDVYPFHDIEQGYLCTSPVVRIRRQDNEYFLTYKSKGLMVRKEYNLPLTEEAYLHLRTKIDGLLISNPREGLLLAEVEFQSEEEALAFSAPDWFEEDVTCSSVYHNSNLSSL